MTHCVKIPLTGTSDLFVYGADGESITYEVRDHDGNKLEPRTTSKLTFDGQKAHFDKRFISLDLLRYCRQVTNS